MIATAVHNEFAKMRRLRVTPLIAVIVAGVVLLSCRELIAPGFVESATDPSGRAWDRLLASMAFAVPLVTPILVAVLASRQVDLEHQGQGWLFSHTAGLPPGRLCRTKFLATGAVLTTATLVQSGLVLGIGTLVGITADPPAGRWLVYTASVVVVNLVLLALHLLLATLIENQLVGLGVSVLGVFFAASASGMPPWMAHLTPWGYYALATPVDYRGQELVPITPWSLSIVALAGVGAAVFVLATRHLDRQEV